MLARLDQAARKGILRRIGCEWVGRKVIDAMHSNLRSLLRTAQAMRASLFAAQPTERAKDSGGVFAGTDNSPQNRYSASG
jgi:hypothetical protein